ncbi:unnamed protein product [Effrenium voratum]|nr:unnamed protein product [Effrenium voratum]
MESTSFVNSKLVPQMADAADVLQACLAQHPLVAFPVLVPNARGLEAALAAGAKEATLLTAASDTFAQKNTNCTVEENLQRAAAVLQRAKAAHCSVRGAISVCLGCPYEGEVPARRVAQVASRLLEDGCQEVLICDTIGTGTAGSVQRVLEELRGADIPMDRVGVHFHDTYGQAVANTLVALQFGVTKVDAAVGGVGGCPFAGPGASGNVATEDLLQLLEGLGVHTGLDMTKLAETGQWLTEQVLGRPNGGAGKTSEVQAKACANANITTAGGAQSVGGLWARLMEPQASGDCDLWVLDLWRVAGQVLHLAGATLAYFGAEVVKARTARWCISAALIPSLDRKLPARLMSDSALAAGWCFSQGREAREARPSSRRAAIAGAVAGVPCAAGADGGDGLDGAAGLRAVSAACVALAGLGLALQGRPSVLRGEGSGKRSSLAKKAVDLSKLQFGVQDPEVPLPAGVQRGHAPARYKVEAHLADELEEKGVVLVPGALKDWVEFLRQVTDHQVEHPHLWSLVGRGGDSYDYIQRNVWMTNNGYRDFMYYSPLCHVLAQLARTSELRPSTDVLIVNPNDGINWHQDNQNGPIDADYAIRWWTAMDACGEGKIGVPEYLIGSHRNQTVKDEVAVDISGGDLPRFTDCTEYVVQPGDLIVWNTRTVHRIRDLAQATPRESALPG